MAKDSSLFSISLTVIFLLLLSFYPAEEDSRQAVVSYWFLFNETEKSLWLFIQIA